MPAQQLLRRLSGTQEQENADAVQFADDGQNS